MKEQNAGLDTIQDIRKMMERSSRFISLSGISGIAAGICGLAGAWFARRVVEKDGDLWAHAVVRELSGGTIFSLAIDKRLFIVALLTFSFAFALAFLFTWLRSRKNGIPIWGSTSRRLLVNVALPMAVGGIFVVRMITLGEFGLIAPTCLIFYGLALVNAAKFTLGEVKWLGWAEILLGLVNLWWLGYGLYFWTIGFGLLHIVYGALMWWKYERIQATA